MYMRDGLSGKGAAVFADELSAAFDSGMGSIKISLAANIVSTRSALFKLTRNKTGRQWLAERTMIHVLLTGEESQRKA